MKLSDISDSTLKYGDDVEMKDNDSIYAGKAGKILQISPSAAVVRFEGIKKTVTVMLDALEKI